MRKSFRISFIDIGTFLFGARAVTGILEYHLLNLKNLYIVNGILQVLFIVMSLWLINRYGTRRKLYFFEKCLLLFLVLVMLLAGGAITGSNILYNIFRFTLIPYSIISYFFFALVYHSGKIISRKWIILFFILFIISCFAMIKTEGINDYYEIYFLLCCMPIVLTRYNDLGKEKREIFIFFVVIFMSFISNKRTALLACVIAFIVWIIIYMYKNESSIGKFIVLAISVIGIFVSYYIFIYYASRSSSDFLRSFSYSELTSSSRMLLWNDAINLWKGSMKTVNVFWGYGYEAYMSVSFAKMQAHNDFIEFLYDYGVIGVTLYIAFCLGNLKIAIKGLISRLENSEVGISIFVMFIIISSISIMYYNPQYYSLMMAFWGIQTHRYYLNTELRR